MSLRAALGRFTQAFRNRDYAIYCTGNSASLIGLWMQRIAVGWLTWQLTESGFWLGLVAFADLAPTVVISPFSGAFADRVDKMRLAKVTQAINAAAAALLAALAIANLLTIWVILGLVFVQGVTLSFWQPVRLTLIGTLVRREDLTSAIAINSVIFNAARFIGPAIAGVVIVAAGPGWAIAVYALTICLFIVSFFFLRVPPELAPRRGESGFLRDIVDGYVYMLGHPGIGPMFLILAVACATLRPLFELLPGFADEVFGRGAGGLSALASTTGVGAVLSGLWLGQRPAGVKGMTKLSVHSALVMAVACTLFAATNVFWVGLVAIAVAGATMTLNGASAQTLVQSAVAPEMRGRVMALYGTLFRSAPAVGALAMGTASEQFGLQAPLIVGCALTGLVWLWALRRLSTISQALEGPPPGTPEGG